MDSLNRSWFFLNFEVLSYNRSFRNVGCLRGCLKGEEVFAYGRACSFWVLSGRHYEVGFEVFAKFVAL